MPVHGKIIRNRAGAGSRNRPCSGFTAANSQCEFDL